MTSIALQLWSKTYLIRNFSHLSVKMVGWGLQVEVKMGETVDYFTLYVIRNEDILGKVGDIGDPYRGYRRFTQSVVFTRSGEELSTRFAEGAGLWAFMKITTKSLIAYILLVPGHFRRKGSVLLRIITCILCVPALKI